MPTVRLIYVSRMTRECDTKALLGILDVSRRKNQERDISGILCYDPRFFLQCLEGPREAVNKLYGQILNDDRHTDVILLEYVEAEKRVFGSWSMAYLTTNDLDREALIEYTSSGRFDPYSMTADQARDFLIATVKQRGDLLADQMAKGA